MSVETEITRIKDNISNAYTKLEEKGATIPEEKNSNNLPSTIETITGGGGGGGDIYSELWNLRTENNTNWTRLFNYYGSISDGYTEADLTEIIKKLDSSSVKYMINTFYYGYFKSGTVPNVDILNFDSLEDGSSAFERMDTKYTNFQLGDFSFPKAKILNGTFQGNYYLTKIGKIIAPLCEDFQYCFSYCRALETIEEINISGYVSNEPTSSYSNKLRSIFNNCSKLVNITFVGSINASLNLEEANGNMTHETLLSAVNALGPTEVTKTLQMGTSNQARLSDEEKAIATEKGWTIA